MEGWKNVGLNPEYAGIPPISADHNVPGAPLKPRFPDRGNEAETTEKGQDHACGFSPAAPSSL